MTPDAVDVGLATHVVTGPPMTTDGRVHQTGDFIDAAFWPMANLVAEENAGHLRPISMSEAQRSRAMLRRCAARTRQVLDERAAAEKALKTLEAETATSEARIAELEPLVAELNGLIARRVGIAREEVQARYAIKDSVPARLAELATRELAARRTLQALGESSDDEPQDRQR